MEMTANFWNPGAGGGGDLRATVLARAPQVATFVLALALAAQLAFIVVAMTSRSRQTPPPPVRCRRAGASARHRRPGQRTSVWQRRRSGERRCRECATVEHAAGAGGGPRDGRPQAGHGDHWRERPGGEGRRRRSAGARRRPVALRVQRPRHHRSRRGAGIRVPPAPHGRAGRNAGDCRPRRWPRRTATRPCSNACASW